MDEDFIHVTHPGVGINSTDHPAASDFLAEFSARASEWVEEIRGSGGDLTAILASFATLVSSQGVLTARALARIEADARGTNPPEHWDQLSSDG